MEKQAGLFGSDRSPELSAMNNFSRFQKMTAVKVAFRNTRYVTRWLYWRGLFKIFIPSFSLIKNTVSGPIPGYKNNRHALYIHHRR